MGFFDKERAEKAYERQPSYNLNKLLGDVEIFTKYDELKVSDHRLSYELKRIANSLEKIEKHFTDGES